MNQLNKKHKEHSVNLFSNYSGCSGCFDQAFYWLENKKIKSSRVYEERAPSQIQSCKLSSQCKKLEGNPSEERHGFPGERCIA